ncbi:MAG TPA: phytoene/squalene synthase family protein, partial [Solirubrobacterales bacterium]
ERARTFAFAARFLPPEQRDATTVLYAFCRVIDDLADEPDDLTPAAVRERLAAWRSWVATRGAAPVPEPAALARATLEVVTRYEVPAAYLLGLIDGIESDLGPVRVPDYLALRRYCLRVAGTVGLAMCHVLGVRHPIALAAAAELGIAMQLTNVLRDVGGDLRRDRVYLPADDLARFDYTAAKLFDAYARGGQPDAALKALLAFEVKRARAHYARGLAGVWLLPAPVRPSILMAGRLYRAILDRIEASDYDVLRRRAATSRATKVREAAIAVLLSRLWGEGPREEVGASMELIPSRPLEPLEMMEDLAWLGS